MSIIDDSLAAALNLLSGLIDFISGKRTSILTSTYELVGRVSEQVSSLGDNLASNTRVLSDQIESSRVNLSRHIDVAVGDINQHADENTSVIIRSITATTGQTNKKLDELQATMSHLGEDIGKAIADNIQTIVNAITAHEQELINATNEGFIRLEKGISDAIAMQGAQFAQAIDHASASIDKLTDVQRDMVKTIHDELSQLRKELVTSIDDHSKTLDKAIRESAFGISVAIGGETAATAASGAEIALAITAMGTLIAEAIGASTVANKLLMAGKIAKDIELAEILISILSAVGAVAAVESPEALSAIITPVIQAYFNIGKTVTEDLHNSGD